MHNLASFIIAAGYVGIFITIFAESGFFLGFFLPGDSLLFTLGVLASTGRFNIFILVFLAVAGAILGDSFGYWVGHRLGPKLFNRPDSLLFKRDYVTRTENFYARHGRKTIILARFVPIVRTFAPIMAGVGRMPYRQFLTYNVMGGSIWAGGLLSLGFCLGRIFPPVEHYLTYIIVVIIFLSIIPIILEIIRSKPLNKP